MKVGDNVLCIKSHSTGDVVAGKEYVIDGFNCCPNCGMKTLFLVGFTKIVRSTHEQCGFTDGSTERINFASLLFILPDLESLHQHRTEVSAKELLTVKEIQHQ